MVRCPDCETPNSVDSKFCKFCGAPLPEEERVDAQLKQNELVAEGFKLFNEGRTDEAALIAESALASNPNETQALSLKGMCLERRGELAEALEHYERVVELNPDSPLDKIKVSHVRNLLTDKVADAPKPNRRVAIIGASAAVVLVMAAGAIMASMGASGQPKSEPLTQTDDRQVTGFDPAMVASAQTPQSNESTNPTPPNSKAVSPPVIQDRDQSPVGPITIEPLPGQLPQPSAGGETNVATAEQGPVPTAQGGANNAAGPAKTDDPDPGMDKPDEKEKEKPGVIEINVHNDKPKKIGGSESVDGLKHLKVLVQTAGQKLLLRDYLGAAKAYEQAVRAGGDPAGLNQHIGQCYAALGRKSEAINAYTKAVDAFQAEIGRRGETSALRRGLESCRAALKVLRS